MPTPLEMTARRAMVAELRRQEPDISARKIASRLGVGKDAILRDLAAIQAEQSQAAPPPTVLRAVSEPGTPDSAPHSAPGTPADDELLTVACSDQLREDLAVLAQAGHTPDEAVSLAVSILARAYTGAWTFGLYPPGTAPRVRVVDLYPYDPKGRTR